MSDSQNVPSLGRDMLETDSGIHFHANVERLRTYFRYSLQTEPLSAQRRRQQLAIYNILKHSAFEDWSPLGEPRDEPETLHPLRHLTRWASQRAENAYVVLSNPGESATFEINFAIPELLTLDQATTLHDVDDSESTATDREERKLRRDYGMDTVRWLPSGGPPGAREKFARDVRYIMDRLTMLHRPRQARIWMTSHNSTLDSTPIETMKSRGVVPVIEAVEAEEQIAQS